MYLRALTLMISLISATADAGIIHSDGEFHLTDWTMYGRTVGGNATAFLGESRITNPIAPQPPAFDGAYRLTHQVYGTNAVADLQYMVAHIYSPFVFDPALGALTEVDLSFRAFLPSTPPPGSFIRDTYRLVGAAILQDGHTFLHGLQVPNDAWNLVSFNNLTESDFFYFGPLSQTPQLDFSSSGAPIQFGYFTHSAGYQATSAFHAIDDWRLEVNSQINIVPEPSSFVVGLGLIASALPLRVRRRRGLCH